MTKFFILQPHDPSFVYAFVMGRWFGLKPNSIRGEIFFLLLLIILVLAQVLDDCNALIINKLVHFSFK